MPSNAARCGSGTPLTQFDGVGCTSGSEYDDTERTPLIGLGLLFAVAKVFVKSASVAPSTVHVLVSPGSKRSGSFFEGNSTTMWKSFALYPASMLFGLSSNENSPGAPASCRKSEESSWTPLYT